MVRITVDTEKDSHHTIQKIIALLQQFSLGHVPVQTNAPAAQPSYQQSSYQEGTPAGTSGYADMFGEMPTSEPVKPKNAYADMFALSEPEPAPQQNTARNFFDMASETKPTTTSSNSPSSGGMFDMFAKEPAAPSSPTTTMTDMFAPHPTPKPVKQTAESLTSVEGFPSVFDDYTEEKKEDFSTKDYLKVKEYDE